MSPFLIWSDNLILGIPSVDAQHQELGEMLNRLAACAQDIPSALALLDAIYAHTREHFQHEEELMEQSAFPERHAHHTEHLLLLAELKDFIAQLKSGKTPLEYHSLSALKAWLVAHIKRSDRPFAEHYLAAKRARIS